MTKQETCGNCGLIEIAHLILTAKCKKFIPQTQSQDASNRKERGSGIIVKHPDTLRSSSALIKPNTPIINSSNSNIFSTEDLDKKFILDVCCGGRMFWENKHHENVLYLDNRRAEKGHIGNGFNPNHEVQPDVLMDFRKLDLPNNTFNLVVFDPPHLTKLQENSVIRKKFGVLDNKTWKEDLKKAFDECMRVLTERGVLVFKWNEGSISHSEVLSLFPQRPLFGHLTAKAGKTKWFVFMKITEERQRLKILVEKDFISKAEVLKIFEEWQGTKCSHNEQTEGNDEFVYSCCVEELKAKLLGANKKSVLSLAEKNSSSDGGDEK